MSKDKNFEEVVKNIKKELIKDAEVWLRPYIEDIVKNVITERETKNPYEIACEYRRYPYYSQVGQDRVLNEYIFKDKKNGFFVDIGANDGYHFSNTYFFEDKLNWDGICIEPIPHIFKKLKGKRKCKCIRTAVSQIKGKINFIIDNNFDMLSCIYDDKYQDKIKNGNARLIKVPSKPLSEILQGINKTIDFMSIDVEGNELDVLKSFNIEDYDIKVFTIENNSCEEHIKNFLIPKGYRYLFTIGGLDEIFVREDYYKSEEIYNNFI